jgi:hypothetical protein
MYVGGKKGDGEVSWIEHSWLRGFVSGRWEKRKRRRRGNEGGCKVLDSGSR